MAETEVMTERRGGEGGAGRREGGREGGESPNLLNNDKFKQSIKSNICMNVKGG